MENELILIYSKYLKNNSYSTYDVLKFQNKYYAGMNLFKNFGHFLGKNWEVPVTEFTSPIEASEHYAQFLAQEANQNQYA